MSTLELRWNTSSCDIPRTQENLDFVEKQLKTKYYVDEYLIASENDPKDHFHLIGFTTKKNWDNFIKSLVEKYKLRTTTKGGKRKYATLSAPIQNLEKLQIYCTKQSEGNTEFLRSNLETSELMAFYEKSFKKNEKKKLAQEVHEALEEQHKYPDLIEEQSQYAKTGLTQYINIMEILIKIKLNIINYLRTSTDSNMCRSNILSYTQYHLKHTEHFLDEEKDILIYYLFF